jgi:CheY-like chemotaxis protein
LRPVICHPIPDSSQLCQGRNLQTQVAEFLAQGLPGDAEEAHVDLLLLDVHMPELDGFQVVRHYECGKRNSRVYSIETLETAL